MAAKESGRTRGRKPKAAPQKRGDYIAGARFKNDGTQLFHIRNAYSLEDARRMVLDEVGRENVRCLLVSECRQKH